MVYLKSVENVIPLSKLTGLLFLFCLPLLSILFLKTKRNDLARPVMGTIFLYLASQNGVACACVESSPRELQLLHYKKTAFFNYLCRTRDTYPYTRIN